jgi:phage tail protein X
MVGPLGTENYIYNGFEGNPTVLAQEFLAVEGLDYTADQIRNLVSAGNSLTYNVNTGKFDVVISGMSTNDLSLDFENKLFLQVAYANVGTVDETGTAKTNTLTALLQDIYTKLGNTITSSTTDANNGITKNGNVVGLGGSLNANTTVSMGAHKLAFTGNEVSVEQLMLGAYTTDANGAIVASAGVRRIFIDVTNGMLSYIPN